MLDDWRPLDIIFKADNHQDALVIQQATIDHP
jgi:hypothetical protein